ncbi:MAG TPA: hypothetical protein VIP28_15315 [Nocardioides sp.]
MPDQLALHQAAAILRGQAPAVTHQDRAAAAARVLRELNDLQRVAIFARRLVDALDARDEDAAGKARRGLDEALRRNDAFSIINSGEAG